MAIYLASVSLAYAILSAVRPETADAFVIAFVALLLIPVLAVDAHRWRTRG